ncbi:unnamed protein product [Clonostachys rosea]|uniref:Uncharacterized protein n=1 Tax=Bionectria ochroleuca TaxID=29856 RepID=A0ABY6UU32_BIOOC|nr:unnamed protein product [Clonostachys rosea]
MSSTDTLSSHHGNNKCFYFGFTDDIKWQGDTYNPSRGETYKSRQMIEPREVVAELGDYIEWHFWSGTHEISRGDYDHPCFPFEDFHPDGQGFSSGEKVVESSGQDLQLNESEPVFFYSRNNDDCSEHRMVGVINPTEEKNLQSWNDNIWRPTVQVTQRDESSGTRSSRSCGDGDFILNAGQVVGIALGGAAAIFIAGLLGFFCHRHSLDGPAITGCHTPRFPASDWDKKGMEQLIEEAEEAQCLEATSRESQPSFYPISGSSKCLSGEEYEPPSGKSPDRRGYENVSLTSMFV